MTTHAAGSDAPAGQAPSLTPRLDGHTAIVTGGNGGLGRETAAGLARRGVDVVITVRDPARGEAAARALESRGLRVTPMVLDLASFASIADFVAAFRRTYARLDILVNNAGVLLGDRRETADGIEMTLGVNHIGPFVLTHLLLDLLIASAPARIVNVASRAHRRVRGLDFADLQSRESYRPMRVYGASKLANIYFTRELARRLEGTGVTVNAVHPGLVATDLAGDRDAPGPIGWFFRLASPLLRTPERGAQTSIWAATDPQLRKTTGGYFADCKPGRLYPWARNDIAAGRLWTVTEALVRDLRPDLLAK